jgi:hypothetical protein
MHRDRGPVREFVGERQSFHVTWSMTEVPLGWEALEKGQSCTVALAVSLVKTA